MYHPFPYALSRTHRNGGRKGQWMQRELLDIFRVAPKMDARARITSQIASILFYIEGERRNGKTVLSDGDCLIQ